MKPKRLTKGPRRAMRSIKEIITATILTSVFSGQALAYAFVVDTTPYTYYQNHDYPAYELAFKAMKETYKVDPHDTTPLIGIAETDLDDDKYPEIISFPTEEPEQKGVYCEKGTDICPHYVLQIRDKKVQTLGIIPAVFVSRGDDIKNGFWTLKAYTKGPADPAYFETYSYDRKKDAYVLAPKP